MIWSSWNIFRLSKSFADRMIFFARRRCYQADTVATPEMYCSSLRLVNEWIRRMYGMWVVNVNVSSSLNAVVVIYTVLVDSWGRKKSGVFLREQFGLWLVCEKVQKYVQSSHRTYECMGSALKSGHIVFKVTAPSLVYAFHAREVISLCESNFRRV